MLEQIVLGSIQGIAEWLPVSSEGLIFLVKTNFFNNGEDVIKIAGEALFLHFGTFLAALIYFRKDVFFLSKSLFNYKSTPSETRKILFFLIVATLISGVIGMVLLAIFSKIGDDAESITKIITTAIGILLLVTAGLQIKAGKGGQRRSGEIKKSEGVILGIVQAFAALPGLSRSGLTVSALLLHKFNEEDALKLSFLLSLPIVLGGNIILNLDKFVLTHASLMGLVTSFVFGILTIGVLLKIARKVNFGWFVFGFGVLTLLSVFI